MAECNDVQALFKKLYDADGTGHMAYADFQDFIMTLDTYFTEEDVRMMVDWLHIEEGGCIHYGDFISWINGCSEGGTAYANARTLKEAKDVAAAEIDAAHALRLKAETAESAAREAAESDDAAAAFNAAQAAYIAADLAEKAAQTAVSACDMACHAAAHAAAHAQSLVVEKAQRTVIAQNSATGDLLLLAERQEAETREEAEAMLRAERQRADELQAAREDLEVVKKKSEVLEAELTARKHALAKAIGEAEAATHATEQAAADQRAAEQAAAAEAAAASLISQSTAEHIAALAASQAASVAEGTKINSVLVPTDMIRKWIIAAMMELIFDETGKIGELFNSGLSEEQIRALGPCELKIRGFDDKVVGLAVLISSWARAKTVVNDVEIPRAVLRGWIGAAINECMRGESGKLGRLFGTLKDPMVGALEPVGVQINSAEDKQAKLAEIVTAWGLQGDVFRKLENVHAPGMYLHLHYGRTVDGTNAEIYHDAQAGSTQWKFELLGGTTDIYILENAKAVGKYLYVASGRKRVGSNVEIHKDKTSPAAHWRVQLVDGSSDIFTLENVNAPGKYLHVSYGRKKDGANVEIYHDKSMTAAQWRIPSLRL